VSDITARQQRILDFIAETVQQRGYPPTVREIGEAVGLTSSSSVHAQLANLEKQGLLRKDPTKPRAMTLSTEESKATGTVVPLLLQAGLVQTWCGLGVLSLLLTALAWGGWPAREPAAPTRALPRPPVGGALLALYVAYALNATGLVPHMVFLVDFVARGLGQGIHAGARYWVLFGLGAVAGPVLAGALADRVGFGPAMRLALVVQAIAVALPTVSADALWLVISSLAVGAAVPGIVPLVLGRVHELVPDDAERQRAAWSVTTMTFALGQAAATPQPLSTKYPKGYALLSRVVPWLAAAACLALLGGWGLWVFTPEFSHLRLLWSSVGLSGFLVVLHLF